MTKITQVRHKTHGSFDDNARISQCIKDFYRSQEGWKKLSSVQKESIDMICLKLSRILSGRADEKDHWTDIAGYANLAEQEIEAR